MKPTVVAVITFCFAFGGALLGIWLAPSARWRPQVDDEESKDTVKLAIGLVSTMTALVLGLVTASAKSSYDQMDSAVKQASINLLALDRVLARYGPEAKDIRAQLKAVAESRIETMWPGKPLQSSAPVRAASNAPSTVEGLVDSIRQLRPGGELQSALKDRAVQLAEDGLQLRWLAMASTETDVPVAFLVIVIFWLTVIFASFGLYAPRNLAATSALVVGSLSVAFALFLVLELGSPFSGVISVSDQPLLRALALMNG
jgi:hypothetical protein